MTYTYRLYGLIISLPFVCPYLPCIETDSAPDVSVAHGPVPKELPEAIAAEDNWKTGFCWQAAPNRYLLKGGRKSGRFLVEDGNRITLHRNPEADDERLLFHLLHPVMAALLRQRGLQVLHASTAYTPKGAIALCGKSGAGKSTTLAAMLQTGCAMVADDVTVLRMGEDKCVEVLPGAARMHLWDDAAKGVGLSIQECGRHPMRRGKAALDAQHGSCSGPVPLRKLYILETGAQEMVTVSRLSGADKIDALMDCIYGPLFSEEHPGLFPLFSATAGQTDIFRIRRPENRWSINEVVEAVLHA